MSLNNSEETIVSLDVLNFIICFNELKETNKNHLRQESFFKFISNYELKMKINIFNLKTALNSPT